MRSYERLMARTLKVMEMTRYNTGF
jgi:hypothetical protein